MSSPLNKTFNTCKAIIDISDRHTSVTFHLTQTIVNVFHKPGFSIAIFIAFQAMTIS